MPNILAKSDIAAEPQTSNPAGISPDKSERRYIPMSVPMSKLFVPDLPGYHLHWFRGDKGRIQRAQLAGYEFVSEQEVDLNNMDIGGESAASGNTDMGTGVSVISGEENGADGQPGRLVLMKVKNEIWAESEKALADVNEKVAEAVRGGKIGAGHGSENANDQARRYTKETENLFTPRKPQKAVPR